MSTETRPATQITPRAYLSSLLIAAAIGIPAALMAVLFVGVEHHLQDWLWKDIPDALNWKEPQWWWVLLVPAVGGLIVALARKLPGDGGHDPVHGFTASPTPPREVVSVTIAALATLSFGAVLGPEAPLVALGSALGLTAAGLMRWADQRRALIATAGSFAAISSIFGNPLNTTFFMLEAGSGIGAALVPAMLPGFLAAGFGYLVYTGFASWSGLPAVQLSVPGLPTYSHVDPSHLLWALVIGVVTAVIAAAVHQSAHLLNARVAHLPPLVVVPCVGLLVGLCAVVFRALTDGGVDLVLFSGQEAIAPDIAETSSGLLAALLLFKALAYMLSLGGGFRGGPVFPAIFLGVTIGILMSTLVSLPATAGASAGIAAGMTAMLRFPFSGVLFAILLTGAPGLDATPLAIIASVAAYVTVRALEARGPAAADNAT